MKAIHEVGTRKTAVARATLRPGTGVVRLNGQTITSLPESMFTSKILEPVILAGEIPSKVDITVEVHGGGPNSQAEAARLAIAKTLSAYDKSLQKVYSDYDRALLVADVRRKESAKPNRQGKARAKRQKSYR
ncbi:30S ribosomal protein S9 [Candidatus Woesearchaeota archaeon]|nr:30S ribosomal protein S9 [Candidatus Woesearchaeota archaeon]